MDIEKLKNWIFKPNRSTRIGICLTVFIFHFSLFTFVSAQDDEPAPPPLKIVTKEERAKLDGEPDLKNRTKLAVEMMTLRITEAEKLHASEDFEGVFRQFGHFRGLMDYTRAFLKKQDTKQNRALDIYKRVELCLRALMPRIEAIRRELPSRYEDYVSELMIYLRGAREMINDAMLSDTVIPTGDKNEK